jgi:hypothetical protein
MLLFGDLEKWYFNIMMKQLKGIKASVITVETAAPEAPYTGISQKFSITLSSNPEAEMTKYIRL